MEKGREKNNRYTWRRKKGIKEEKEEAEGRGNNQSEGARVLQTRGPRCCLTTSHTVSSGKIKENKVFPKIEGEGKIRASLKRMGSSVIKK